MLVENFEFQIANLSLKKNEGLVSEEEMKPVIVLLVCH